MKKFIIKYKFEILLILIFVIATAIVYPFVEIGLTDSWRYAYPVKSLLEGRGYELGAHFAPNLFLQVFYGYLFGSITGFSFTALRFSTLVVSIFLSILIFNYLKRIQIADKIALVITLLIVFNPLFFNLTYSFMTDIPFLFLSLLSFWFFRKFYNNKQIQTYIIALLFSTSAFLIRQPAILYPLVFITIYVIFNIRDKKNRLLFLFTVLYSVGIWIVTNFVKSEISPEGKYVSVASEYIDILSTNPLYFATEIFKKFYKAIIYIGLFSLPLIPFLLKRLIKMLAKNRWVDVGIFVFNATMLFFMFRADKIFPFGGSVIYDVGLGPATLKDIFVLQLDHVPTLPAFFWIALTFTGQIAGSYMILNLAIFIIKKKNIFLIALILTLIAYLASMSITSFFDRYLLLPSVAFILIVVELDEFKTAQRLIFSRLLIIPFIWFSVIATSDYFSWNRAREQAFIQLQNKGENIKSIDAGMEYNGWFNYKHNYKEIPDKSYWWVTDDKYILTFGDIPNYQKTDSVAFFRLMQMKHSYIYTLKRKTEE